MADGIDTTAGAPAAGATPPAAGATPPAAGQTALAAGATPPAAGATPPKEPVPEQYEFQMPEGVQLDTDAAAEFSVVAKELGLSQKEAQKVAQVGAQMALRQRDAQVKQTNEWLSELQNDKELGGESYQANLAVARKAIDTFGDPKLVEVLNTTGLGNNPAIVRWAYKVGKAISDDGIVRGDPLMNGKPMAEIMYPSMRNQ